MKLLNKIFILFIFLGSLQILSEGLLQDKKVISTEINLEIEKEEKENKTEFFIDYQEQNHSSVSIIIYNKLVVGPYQPPFLSVWTTPPEALV